MANTCTCPIISSCSLIVVIEFAIDAPVVAENKLSFEVLRIKLCNVPYLAFFVPAGGGGGGGGTVAKDALGDDVTVKVWKESHTGGARELVQGLKGDATYLILDDQKNMADFAINACALT